MWTLSVGKPTYREYYQDSINFVLKNNAFIFTEVCFFQRQEINLFYHHVTLIVLNWEAKVNLYVTNETTTCLSRDLSTPMNVLNSLYPTNENSLFHGPINIHIPGVCSWPRTLLITWLITTWLKKAWCTYHVTYHVTLELMRLKVAPAWDLPQRLYYISRDPVLSVCGVCIVVGCTNGVKDCELWNYRAA